MRAEGASGTIAGGLTLRALRTRARAGVAARRERRRAGTDPAAAVADHRGAGCPDRLRCASPSMRAARRQPEAHTAVPAGLPVDRDPLRPTSNAPRWWPSTARCSTSTRCPPPARSAPGPSASTGPARSLADLRFDAIGLLTAADPLQMQASGRIAYSPTGLPRWVLNADVDGDLKALGITGQLTEPFRADLRGGRAGGARQLELHRQGPRVRLRPARLRRRPPARPGLGRPRTRPRPRRLSRQRRAGFRRTASRSLRRGLRRQLCRARC